MVPGGSKTIEFSVGDLVVYRDPGDDKSYWAAILLRVDRYMIKAKYIDTGKQTVWTTEATRRCVRNRELIWYPVKG